MTRLDEFDAAVVPAFQRHPQLLFFVIATVFAVATTLHAQRFPPRQESPAARAVADAPVEDVAAATVERGGEGRPPQIAPEQPGAVLPKGALLVGPQPGLDVAAYVEERRAALVRLADAAPQRRVAALASLDPMSPAHADALVAHVAALDGQREGPVVQAVRYRLLEGATHERVRVAQGVAQRLDPLIAAAAGDARAEADELERLASTSQDAEFEAQFRADSALLRERATALAQGCACVYALELHGSLRQLALLADQPGVRLVDVAPTGADPRRVLFVAVPP